MCLTVRTAPRTSGIKSSFVLDVPAHQTSHQENICPGLAHLMQASSRLQAINSFQNPNQYPRAGKTQADTFPLFQENNRRIFGPKFPLIPSKRRWFRPAQPQKKILARTNYVTQNPQKQKSVLCFVQKGPEKKRQNSFFLYHPTANRSNGEGLSSKIWILGERITFFLNYVALTMYGTPQFS